MTTETLAIEVDYDLAQTPANVWRALTEPALLARWLMANDIRPVVGHRFNFRAEPIPGRWDGIVDCEVLAVEPMKLLRYSWKGGRAEVAGARLDTIVTWTLAPTATGGTKLHLSHTGFVAANRFAFEAMDRGWREHLAKRITDLLAHS